MFAARRLALPFLLALLLHGLAGLWLLLGQRSHEQRQPPHEVEVRLQPPPEAKPPEPPKLRPPTKPEPLPAARPEPRPLPAPAPVLAAREPAPESPVAPVPVPSQPAPRPAQPPAPEPVLAPRFDAAYLNNPRPAYPMMARRNGEEGKVLLRVHVTEDGRAAEVQVQAGSGSPSLDRAAREAVSHWRFVPARQGSQAVAAWVLVPIVFKLED